MAGSDSDAAHGLDAQERNTRMIDPYSRHPRGLRMNGVSGDAAGFGDEPIDLLRLFQSARRDLHAFVSRLVGSDEVDDILQETWLNLHQRGTPATWRNPRAFLFATARNLALDSLRRKRRWERVVPPGEEPPDPVCPGPGPDAQAIGKQLVARIAAALNELPPACRDAFLLNRLYDCTHAEIADRLGISTKTVQRHIERALLHCLRRTNGADAAGFE